MHRAEPRRVTLYETSDLQLVGHAFPSFWRPAAVPVRVGSRVETGLHLLQLYTKFAERTEEVPFVVSRVLLHVLFPFAKTRTTHAGKTKGFGYLQDAAFRESYEAAQEAGYIRLDWNGEHYVPTLKGAFLMTWKELWPWKMIREKQMEKNAREILGRLGRS